MHRISNFQGGTLSRPVLNFLTAQSSDVFSLLRFAPHYDELFALYMYVPYPIRRPPPGAPFVPQAPVE